MIFVYVAAIGILAGVISGIVGTGSSIILLPALIYAFGPKEAVPIMAVASVIGNVSRVMAWRNSINIKAFLYYSLPGIPAAVLGARTLWVLPAHITDMIIASFFLLLIPWRRWAKVKNFTITNWQLSIAGVFLGFLTGIVFSTGPLTVPLFASYGLTKGALLSTEAAASFVIYISKSITFGTIGALPVNIIANGLLVGTAIAAGVYLGKFFVLKMPLSIFEILIDLMLLFSAAVLFWSALA
ncbi:sulfite exporter TauE/SafE family protein [Brenneria tiliae]|uniref:sulfite exporter TauE/SafE family protein n=1 Tax=Brenneria tiliae TaxID=2914984 RepID=UPI002014E995|nr:sulfite exporter TauE/SafE family protein [Brenneria tiliae]MCL2898759.1 sulfite exporter TauE/SafE family protein [Brenneria tiliae]MCL2903304.1 sulfite exporter TauE/SafE family protein [Brenneria tiliae]